MTQWVEYAKSNDAIILFDAAYEAYITDAAIPHSIYEIPGRAECAIEFRASRKTAGFTGVRCAFTVVPKTLKGTDEERRARSTLYKLWNRRHTTKFNGVSYIVQAGRRRSTRRRGSSRSTRSIDFYMTNAKIIREGLTALGIKVYGGVNAPYVWVKTPAGTTSWAVLRPTAQRVQRRRHAGQRVRGVRRGVLPAERV